MATLYTSRTSLTAPVPARVGMETITVPFTYSQTAGTAFVLNDVLQLVKIPAGATVLDGMLVCTALDSSTGIVLDIGDGVVPDRYVDGSTIGRSAAGGTVRFGQSITTGTNAPYTYTSEDTVDLLIQTAASGTASTTFTVAGYVTYTMQS